MVARPLADSCRGALHGLVGFLCHRYGVRAFSAADNLPECVIGVLRIGTVENGAVFRVGAIDPCNRSLAGIRRCGVDLCRTIPLDVKTDCFSNLTKLHIVLAVNQICVELYFLPVREYPAGAALGEDAGDRIGEVASLPFHTTVRTVRYTAVHKFSQTFRYWPKRDGYPARASLSFVMTELSICAALHGPFLQFAISWTLHSSTRSLRSIL